MSIMYSMYTLSGKTRNAFASTNQYDINPTIYIYIYIYIEFRINITNIMVILQILMIQATENIAQINNGRLD